MAKMSIDNEGLLVDPCLSCDKPYMEDIWNEWCCDEKECPFESAPTIIEADTAGK